MLCEHHLTEQMLGQFVKKTELKGWRTFGQPATPGHHKGTTAGVALVMRKGLYATTLDEQVLSTVPPDLLGGAPRYISCMVRLRKCTVLVIAAYCYVDEQGIGDKNARILEQISHLISIHQVPVILGADFNFSEEVLVASGWLSLHGLSVVAPQVSTTTCGGSSVIDYFAVSTQLVESLTEVDVLYGSLWAPHFAVKLGVRGKPVEDNIVRLLRPDPLPIADFEAHVARYGFDPEVWHEAGHRASARLKAYHAGIMGKRPAIMMEPSWQNQCCPQSIANAAGAKLSLAMLRVEIYVASVLQLHGLAGNKITGGAQWPRFRKGPVRVQNKMLQL